MTNVVQQSCSNWFDVKTKSGKWFSAQWMPDATGVSQCYTHGSRPRSAGVRQWAEVDAILQTYKATT